MKVKALRDNQAGTFWAVGPVFSVKYPREDVVEFVLAPKPKEALMWS